MASTARQGDGDAVVLGDGRSSRRWPPLGLAHDDRVHSNPGLVERPGTRISLLVGSGSAQPGGDHRRRRLLHVGLQRQALPRLLESARQRQHRSPTPQTRGRHSGAGREVVHDRPFVRQRCPQRSGPFDHRVGPWRHEHGVFHQRWCRSSRERLAHGAPVHRPTQGAHHLSLVPRRHIGSDCAHR